MTHLTDDQLNELLDTRTQVDTYTRTHVRHLDTCEACRARLENLQRVFTALESIPEIVPPRDLTTSILAQLPPVLSELPIRSKWLFAAQTLSALAIAAWLASSFVLPPEIATYQPPTLDSLFASTLLILSSFSFEFDPSSSLVHLFSFTQNLSSSSFLFPLSSFEFQSSATFAFLSSAAILWLVGNGVLLRAPARNNQ